jgi:hypothetical protein
MDWCAFLHRTAEGDDLSRSGSLVFESKLSLLPAKVSKKSQLWSNGVLE